MNSNYPMDRILILIFIALFLIVYLISQHESDKVRVRKHKDIVRGSYGDEFYNYRTSEGNNTQPDISDNIEEVIYETEIIEGFTGHIVDDTVILKGHKLCPVRGSKTGFTSCIHSPNKVIKGLDKIIDYGFLVSVSSRSSLDLIQRSLDTHGEYDIIFKNNKFILTKNNIEKQVLLECNAKNLNRVQQLVGTTTI